MWKDACDRRDSSLDRGRRDGFLVASVEEAAARMVQILCECREYTRLPKSDLPWSIQWRSSQVTPLPFGTIFRVYR